VEDTGQGISPQNLSRIFDAFDQADAKGRICGTGLGLAISRTFARLMQGDLVVESVARDHWREARHPLLEAAPGSGRARDHQRLPVPCAGAHEHRDRRAEAVNFPSTHLDRSS
jgi:signal transduction histidine kinase